MFKKIIRTLYTLTYFVSLIPARFYDILHKTEYSGIEKTGDRDGRYEYYPSPVLLFPFLKRHIQKHMHSGKGHSVIDIGCGKGFMLLFFSRLGFDRVAGIEYDSRLCALAHRNLAGNSGRILLYNCDAMAFEHYKDYDTFYMYNPFDASILEKVTEQILASLKTAPRNIVIIYCNPVYGDILEKKGFRKRRSFYYKTTIYTYSWKKR